LDNILTLPTFTDVNPNSLANTYAGISFPRRNRENKPIDWSPERRVSRRRRKKKEKKEL
jgi:hypothetical protein